LRLGQLLRRRRRGFGERLYSSEQRGELPDAAVLASLGCGNPTAVAELLATVRELCGAFGLEVEDGVATLEEI